MTCRKWQHTPSEWLLRGEQDKEDMHSTLHDCLEGNVEESAAPNTSIADAVVRSVA